MYRLMPAKDENILFFRLDGEAAKRYGAIGYFRADFGKKGNSYNSLWFDNQNFLKTHFFIEELKEIIDALRSSGPNAPFANRRNLEMFCTMSPGKSLTTRGNGYYIRTDNYSYCFRCYPRSGGDEGSAR